MFYLSTFQSSQPNTDEKKLNIFFIPISFSIFLTFLLLGPNSPSWDQILPLQGMSPLLSRSKRWLVVDQLLIAQRR